MLHVQCASRRKGSRPSVHGDGGVELSRRLMVPAESAMRFVLLLSCLLGFAGSPAFAQADVGSGTTDAVPDVSLVTFGPGETYWERFGHDAIDRKSTRLNSSH